MTTLFPRFPRRHRIVGLAHSLLIRCYRRLVERIQADTTMAAGQVVSIPLSEAERDLGYSVLAQRNTNGVLTVELLTGGGFPVKHSGYLYVSSGVVQPGSFFDIRWPLRTELKSNWFRICD